LNTVRPGYRNTDAASQPHRGYRTLTRAEVLAGCTRGAEGKKETLMPPAGRRLADATWASDPRAQLESTVIRRSECVLQISTPSLRRKPYFDAAKNHVPTLLVVAEWITTRRLYGTNVVSCW